MQMGTLAHATRFGDLVVYQKARRVTDRIFELTKAFPKEETYSLTDQVRRCSRSIGAQIAEAWGKRRYARHFVSKLTDADAEQLETQHWILVAFSCSYLTGEQEQALLDDLAEIGCMLHSMIQKADLFCGGPTGVVREDAAPYISIADSRFTDH
jgi:four helix bundle protein